MKELKVSFTIKYITQVPEILFVITTEISMCEHLIELPLREQRKGASVCTLHSTVETMEYVSICMCILFNNNRNIVVLRQKFNFCSKYNMVRLLEYNLLF